ncbi:MAG: alpha/beta fold hydrolase [Candidatus Dormibacteraeota bacterium]|nr:alpha/beta fold hydrolase [Candidatus Dormibacteraeota bacterium]
MSEVTTRDLVRVDVGGGVVVAGSSAKPTEPTGRPLIVALHGGLYTAKYFDVPTWPGGSLLDLAAHHGYPIVSFDRPGYGASSTIAPPENTYERQAELLGAAIERIAAGIPAPGVVLVGHSIGGMIALTIAAHEFGFKLLGVSATGLGSVIPPGGASEGLVAATRATGQDTVALPPEQCDQVMFGPSWTFDPGVLEAAHASYAPAPVVELVAASRWAAEKLPQLAPKVTVPVHNALAEFDALWESSPETIARFTGLFTAAPFADASIARGTGHSIDHHKLGHALQLRQLAFADECRVLAERPH